MALVAIDTIDMFQSQLNLAIQSCLNEPNLTIPKIQQQLGPLFADKSDAKKTQFEIVMGKHMLNLLVLPIQLQFDPLSVSVFHLLTLTLSIFRTLMVIRKSIYKKQ